MTKVGNINAKAKLYGFIHAVVIPALLWQHYGVIEAIVYHIFILFLYSTAFKRKAASQVFLKISPCFLGVANGYIIIMLPNGLNILTSCG